MGKNKARIAVLGAGYWGRNLVRNHHALGSLHAVCDPSPSVLEQIPATYPGVTVTSSVDVVLDDPDVTALVIATPAASHGELVRRGLDAGKHIFVEKPLCLDIDEAENLAVEARERDLVLMVGHLLLYHPAFVALRQALVDGCLGNLRYIYSNRLSLGKIRREENALWSFAPHDISMILALAADLPESVVCNGGNYLNSNVADTSLSHLTFPGNLQAHIFVSWLHPYKEQRLVVVGDLGMAVFDDVCKGSEKLLFYPHNVGWEGEFPMISKASAEPIFHQDEEPLKLECRAFIDAVEQSIQPPSDAAEGVRVLRVLDACQRALIGGTRIDLHS